MKTPTSDRSRFRDLLFGALLGSAVLAAGLLIVGAGGSSTPQERLALPQARQIKTERAQISAAVGKDVLMGEGTGIKKLAVLVTGEDGAPVSGMTARNFNIVWVVGVGLMGKDWATTMSTANVNTSEPGVYGFDIPAGGPKDKYPLYTGFKISVNYFDRAKNVRYQGATLYQLHIERDNAQ